MKKNIMSKFFKFSNEKLVLLFFLQQEKAKFLIFNSHPRRTRLYLICFIFNVVYTSSKLFSDIIAEDILLIILDKNKTSLFEEDKTFKMGKNY